MVALLITVGVIFYMIMIQLDLFQAGALKNKHQMYGGADANFTVESNSIVSPIDDAQNAKAAIETKNKIPDVLLR